MTFLTAERSSRKLCLPESSAEFSASLATESHRKAQKKNTKKGFFQMGRSFTDPRRNRQIFLIKEVILYKEKNSNLFTDYRKIRSNTGNVAQVFRLMVHCLTFLVLCFMLGGSSVEAKMIGQWTFDHSHVTNNVVKDTVGGLDATIVGPVNLNNANPRSLMLNGNNNYVAIAEKGQSVDLPQEDLSVEAWVCLNSRTQWGGIIGYFQDNGIFEKGWLLGYNNSNFTLAVSTTGTLNYSASATRFETGQWYHVVGTYDGSTTTIYVNGRPEKTFSMSGEIDYADACYSIGAYKDDNELFPMDGKLHEVCVYDTALTADEIVANYKAKKTIFPERVELPFGPYLRFVDHNSAVVRWWTNEPSPSILVYGENEPSEHRVTDQTPKTKHEVRLTDLKPDTMYSYSIRLENDHETFVTEIYECDTFFNYCLPAVPDRPSPYSHSANAKFLSDVAQKIIKDTKITRGYCLIIGVEEGQLAYELARRTDLSIIGVDEDAEKVAVSRANLKKAGIYGSRVTMQHVRSLADIPFSSSFANLIVSERHFIDQSNAASSSVARVRMMVRDEYVGTEGEIFRLLCPGGVAYLGIISSDADKWTKITQDVLPGKGQWTHEYGHVDNSANSRETLQGATNTQKMDVQWIGRPGPRAQADRNGRKPSPLAINGRLFVQGLHRIIALDAYNGTILWSWEIPDLERFNMPRDSGNWCADEDYVYVAIKEKCWRLDAATGDLSKLYDVNPVSKNDWDYDWGYIARYDDKLFGSAAKKGTAFTNFWGGSGQGWYDAKSGEATYKVCSENIFALAKDTGKTAWTYQDGVIINSTITIGNDRVYFVECRNDQVKASQSRRIGMSELWDDQYLVALDTENGEKLWEEAIDTADGIVVFYLAYANDSLYLVSSGTKYDLYAYDASTGKDKWNASKPWSSDNHGGHMSRPAIVGNIVFMRPYCFDADSGELLDIKMPGGGCGTYAASTDAIIFRAGNVTMWDFETQKVSSWHRLRPGCWLSTIPACGLVLSPEAGGGCSCGSWMETSIAFAPILKKEER